LLVGWAEDQHSSAPSGAVQQSFDPSSMTTTTSSSTAV
jgi:hypothetical protein